MGGRKAPGLRSKVPETFPDLFRLKAELRPKPGQVPLVKEDQPGACACPAARAARWWNLPESAETLPSRQSSSGSAGR
jgi:hypothetical protein